MTILGLDVGSPQGLITLLDWRALSQRGYRFAFLRCAEGLEASPDAQFNSNVAGSQTAGFRVGPYSVGHPWLDPVAQANLHFGLSKGLGSHVGELSPVLDLELPTPEKWASEGLSGPALLAWTLSYLNTGTALCGRVMTLYTYRYWIESLAKLVDISPLGSFPLWFADYEKNESTPPAPWKASLFWQESGGNGMKVPSGAPCDEDVFCGDERAFLACCTPGAPIPSLPVEPTLDIPTGTT